jgi:hypothetical protein
MRMVLMSGAGRGWDFSNCPCGTDTSCPSVFDVDLDFDPDLILTLIFATPIKVKSGGQECPPYMCKVRSGCKDQKRASEAPMAT